MNRGSVFKRGSTWTVKVELARDPFTGKRRQKWYGGFANKADAQRELTKLLASLDTGTWVDSRRATVAEYLLEWLNSIAATVRPSTLASYRRNLELHVIPHVGGARLAALDGGALNGLYARLLEDGRRDGRPGGLAPRTVRYIHTILHRAFRDAVRWGRLARNPADAADPPRSSSPSTASVWPAATLRSFLESSRSSGDRYYRAWVVLATTGARRGEVLGLRWDDLDLEEGRARVVQFVIAVKHETRFGEPKTARGRRSLALDPGTVRVLREWRRRQAEERLALGPGYRDHGLVFTKITGEPLHPERFSREFDRRVERWGLPKLTLHGLRHTWATLALEAGVHPRVVQERLGHATVSITLGVYSHVAPVMDREAAANVASRLL